MTFVVKSMFVTCPDSRLLVEVVIHLNNNGYTPLIANAKKEFTNLLGNSVSLEVILENHFSKLLKNSDPDDMDFVRYMALSERPERGGDIFYSPSREGFLYLRTISVKETPPPQTDLKIFTKRLEIGYMGDEKDLACLDVFASLITDSISVYDEKIEWILSEPPNALFDNLAHHVGATYTTANAVSEEDTVLAEILEDSVLHEVAIVIKRAGAMLLEDINKKVTAKQADDVVKKLVQAKLLNREFVVICRQTSNQTNRISSMDTLSKMAEFGVLCSCGRVISDERIEELFSPTSALKKMLDQSYWTTAKLVYTLRQLGIQDDHILLNLQQGPEEIDAFVEIDGTLLMFELKDNEFSMGHAYPFAGRIGLFKPDYAVIVSTIGVAPDVKDYFKQIKPQSSIVYIEKLSNLNSCLQVILKSIHTHRAIQVLRGFESVTMPVSPLLAPKIGLTLPRRTRPSDILIV